MKVFILFNLIIEINLIGKLKKRFDSLIIKVKKNIKVISE
jgi:hypothetical protein